MARNNLIEGNISKGLLAFVLPMIAGSLIQQLYTTADAVIVGQFAGKAGLAAIDSVHTLFKFPLNFMNGLAASATIIISGYYGAKDRLSLHRAVRTAITIAGTIGILSAIFGVGFTPQLLRMMSVPADIVDDTRIYCMIYFGGLWAMVLYNMAAGILRAFGDSKRPLYILILCSGINVAADLVFVGVLGLGVGGAAAATVLAQCISVLAAFAILTRSNPMQGSRAIWIPFFSRADSLRMLRVGLPLAMQSVLFPISNTIVQASVNTMGTNSIAAWGISAKLDMLIWLISDSMSPALTTYCAQNIGAKHYDRLKRGVLIGTALSSISVALVSVALYIGTPLFGTWFVPKAESAALVPLVVHYMRMMAPFFVFYAIAEAFAGAVCGLGDTFSPMLTTLLSICLLRVVAIWLILPRFQTMECIVWIYVASWIAAAICFTGLYRFKLRRFLAAHA